MNRFQTVAALLSISLLASEPALAKHPHRGQQVAPPATAQPVANGAIAGRHGARHHHALAPGNFGYGAYPWFGPAYGVRYAPIVGYAPSGFVGAYGNGGFSTTFVGSSIGGQDYFSSPAYGHWGAFGK